MNKAGSLAAASALSSLALVASFAGSASASSAPTGAQPDLHVCYSQMLNDAGPGNVPGPGSSSTRFAPASASSTTQEIQGFTASSTCKVFFIDVKGGLYGNPGPVTGFNVGVYADSAGNPGALLHQSPNSPFTVSGSTYRIKMIPNDWAILNGTTYWIRVVAKVAGPAGNYWYWDTNSTAGLIPARWQNSGNALGTGCTTWTAANLVPCTNSPAPALEFAIEGN